MTKPVGYVSKTTCRDLEEGRPGVISPVRKGEYVFPAHFASSYGGSPEQIAARLQELDAVTGAIGTTRYMDPPDGGDVSLAEQVQRMAAHITVMEAALKPFGGRADRYNDSDAAAIGDSVELWQVAGNLGMRVDITVGHMRAARAALTPPVKA